MYELLYFLIALISCVIGALGGIGGGIIIKPTVDLLGQYSLMNIGLLASSTVLAMTVVSVWKMRRHIMGVGLRLVGLIAIGSLIGGIFGGYIFNAISNYFKVDKYIGIIQTIVLIVVILAVVAIELFKKHLTQRAYRSPLVIIGIGTILGTVSSFLGIGGGPFNKPTIYLLLGLTAKGSTVASLCIVFFSQASNVVRTLYLNGLEPFDLSVLPYMIAGAILGGYLGGLIINKVDERLYDKLFMGVLMVILVINFLNLYQFNSSGETFGPESAATSYEDRPDLIAAVGVDGTEGYIRRTDDEVEMPSSPEEAVKLMHSPEYLYTARVIPLYDSEGKKVIGEFRMEPPRGEDMEVFVEDGVEKVIKKGEPRTLSAEEKKWLNER